MDAENVELLVKAGYNLNHTDNLGRSPLRIAVMKEAKLDVIKVLIEGGADVNHVGKDKFNILERYFSYSK